LLARNFSELNRIGNNLNQTARAQNELLLIAREMGDDRLAGIIAATIEQNRAIYRDLAETLAGNRRALGYDREG
jgi:hypothetical protein